MLRCALAFFTLGCCSVLCKAAAAQSSAASEPNVYYAEDGIKAPVLAPTDFSSVVSSNCEYEGAGIIRISLVVTPQGQSEKARPLYPFDDDIDKAAVSIAEVDRFSPGSKDGVAVAVAQELEIRLTVCKMNVVDKDGTTTARLRLKSVPVQRLFPAPKQALPSLSPIASHLPASADAAKQNGKTKPDITPPVPLFTPAAEWPANQRGVEGASLVQLVIDVNGQPRALRVQRGTNEQFNAKALEAVERYRFTPAKKGKDSVPTKMSILVTFKLH